MNNNLFRGYALLCSVVFFSATSKSILFFGIPDFILNLHLRKKNSIYQTFVHSTLFTSYTRERARRRHTHTAHMRMYLSESAKDIDLIYYWQTLFLMYFQRTVRRGVRAATVSTFFLISCLSILFHGLWLFFRSSVSFFLCLLHLVFWFKRAPKSRPKNTFIEKSKRLPRILHFYNSFGKIHLTN